MKTGLIQVAAAIHPAAVGLSAARGRRRRVATLADGKRRELLLEFFGVALGAFRRLRTEENGLEFVAAGLATIFKNGHDVNYSDAGFSRSDNRNIARRNIIERGVVWEAGTRRLSSRAQRGICCRRESRESRFLATSVITIL